MSLCLRSMSASAATVDTLTGVVTLPPLHSVEAPPVAMTVSRSVRSRSMSSSLAASMSSLCPSSMLHAEDELRSGCAEEPELHTAL